jgi:SAM-dependent methyltransferase
MPDDYKTRIKTHILDDETFVTATFSGQQRGQANPWDKVTVRPVEIKGGRHLQFSYFDARQNYTHNYRGAELAERLDDLLTLPFKSINLQSTAENLRVQLTKKGKAIIHRDQVTKPPQIELTHDRAKNLILPADQPDPFLQALGIMTQDGRIRASMRDKFWQINEFLKLVSQTDGLQDLTPPIHIVDCGCGSAYLTFAAYHYLNNILGLPTRITGVDLKQDLLNKQAQTARSLGWDGITFEFNSIIDFQPAQPPDITLALHACDTATDEALAQGIRWDSHYIFSVPCCHHHLQQQLTAQPPFEPIFRHGILRERVGDILTDSFRALILRIMGYRADVIEFIDAEHTNKNLMIRAVKTATPGEAQFVQEYQALKSFWLVEPYLATLLGEEFEQETGVGKRETAGNP